jgi:HPt (histidine-containing phosphotransfer) domain-containing protein
MQVLDRAHFDSLRAQLAPAVFATLIQSFAEACPVQIHQVSLCAGSGDLAGLALAAHQLRGFAANFGCKRLADLANEIEQACNAGDMRAMPAMVSDLTDISKVTWAEILACMMDPEGDTPVADGQRRMG